MSGEGPSIEEILERNKGVFSFPISINTSKIEALMLSMFKEVQSMKQEITILKEELAKKAEKEETEVLLAEHDRKIDYCTQQCKTNEKDLQEIHENLTANLDKVMVETRVYAQNLIEELAPSSRSGNVTYINQVVSQDSSKGSSRSTKSQQQATPALSTFESSRSQMEQFQPQQKSTRFSPSAQKREGPMRPDSAPKLPFELPKRSPITNVRKDDNNNNDSNNNNNNSDKSSYKPDLQIERIPTPQEFKRMSPEEASEFLINAANTLTPEETGRLAAEMSEHVKDSHVENIFVNLAQRLTPRTTQRIIAELSTYVDDSVSSKIVAAMATQLSEEQVTEMITRIATRIAEEETSRIVTKLSDQFKQQDAVSLVIKMCDRMTPQQTSALVTALAINMTPEESAKVMKNITDKVEPEKTVSLAAEMQNRVDEHQGKVTDQQIKSIEAAKEVAEQASRNVSPTKQRRIYTRSQDQLSNDGSSTISTEQLENEQQQDEETRSKGINRIPLNDNSYEERISTLEEAVKELNTIVLDMHTEIMHPEETDQKGERDQRILELFGELTKVASAHMTQRQNDSRQDSRHSSSRRSLKESIDQLFADKSSDRTKSADSFNIHAPIAAAPAAPLINTDELLDQFLEATHAELEQVKHQLTDENSKSLKTLEQTLRQMITKISATQDVLQKKLSTQYNEMNSLINSEITKTQSENKALFDKYDVTIAQLNERLLSADKRLEEMSAASKLPPPVQKLKVSEDGLVDMQPVIDQLNGQAALCTDLLTRLSHLEKKEVVHPQAFQQVVERIGAAEEKQKEFQQNIYDVEMQASETKTALHDYMTFQSSDDGQRPFKELHERIDQADADIKKLVDGNVKLNKDLTGARAAINTLRSHSEETTSSVEEIRKVCDNVREETVTIDKKMKKVVQYCQTEVDDAKNKIKDILRSIERTDDQLEDVSQKVTELQNRIKNYSGPQQVNPNQPRAQQPSGSNAEYITEPPKVRTIDDSTSPILMSPLESPHQFSQLNSGVFLSSASLNDEGSSNPTRLTAAALHQLQEYNEAQQQQIRWQMQQQHSQSKIPQMPKKSIVKETVLSSIDQKKFAEIHSKISAIQTALSNNKHDIEEIFKKIQNLHDIKADKDELKNVFEQFRIAMGELNNRIVSIRRSINNKVDQSQIEEIMQNMNKQDQDLGTTAAEVRCLLCGSIRRAPAPRTEELPPEAKTKTPAPKEDTGEPCLVYGDNGEQFYGRNSNGKPVVAKHPILAPLPAKVENKMK